MKSLYLSVGILLSVLLWAQDKVVQYDLSGGSGTRIATDLVIRGEGSHSYRFAPHAGSDGRRLLAIDRSSGQNLPTRTEHGAILVDLRRKLNARAEFRLGIEETVPDLTVTQGSGGVRVFQSSLASGRHVVILPAGFLARRCSVPAQVQSQDGRIRLGIVQRSDAPLPVEIEMAPGAPAAAMIPGTFRALDDRTITYFLNDPQAGQIKLWLEIYVTSPGQSHFYSQLRRDDHIQEPETIDMDRGVELPTRIVTGKEANELGDSPTRFPDGSSVLVADLGYKVPPHGSARIRSYQLATDTQNYRPEGKYGFRLNRFLARTHSTYVLPHGWELTSVDQPASISRDSEDRVVLDFFIGGGDASKLTVTGQRASRAD